MISPLTELKNIDLTLDISYDQAKRIVKNSAILESIKSYFIDELKKHDVSVAPLTKAVIFNIIERSPHYSEQKEKALKAFSKKISGTYYE